MGCDRSPSRARSLTTRRSSALSRGRTASRCPRSGRARTGGRDRLHRWVAADPSAYRSSQACCDATTKVPDLMENSVPARPVYVPRGKTHIGTCDEDRRTQHRIDIGFVRGVPIEELQQGVDLIVIPTTWKS